MNEKRQKEAVKEFWNSTVCGEWDAIGNDLMERLETEAAIRESQQPYVRTFARFEDGSGKDVLEIGVGMGSDHLQWSKSIPRTLEGIDLSERAIWFTKQRLAFYGRRSKLCVGDAENLPFASEKFDIVYSWGVLHHTPDTRRAIAEVNRVLRPGGVAKIMIYNKYSLTGLMLWLRYGLLVGRLGLTLRETYDRCLESPGTKAYSLREVDDLFQDFSYVEKEIALSHGDLLIGTVGRRHQGILLNIARAIWPRWFFRRFVKGAGIFLMVAARK